MCWKADRPCGNRIEVTAGVVLNKMQPNFLGERKMKRIIFISLVAVLLMTGTVRADLVVQDYLGLGEKVTLDTATGNHWVWDLSMFTNMTYDEQTAAISDLGTYGYIAGGWHMADAAEIQTMWEYEADEIECQWLQVTVLATDSTGLAEPDLFHFGRFKWSSEEGTHYTCWAGWDEETGRSWKSGIPGPVMSDGTRDECLSAWVVTHQPIVPAPGALILAVTGLLSSTLGLNRLRRKRKEPSQI